MSSNYYLPKNDIDVYVLPIQTLNSNKTAEIIKNELEKRHPGYSANHTYDYKVITIDKKKYLLVTVINKLRLDEHKIIAGKKRIIGVDSLALINGVPEPVLEEGLEDISPKDSQQCLIRLNFQTAEVFKKKLNKLAFFGFFLVLSTILLVIIGLICHHNKPREKVVEAIEINDEIALFAPDLLSILHDLSSVIVESKGFAISALVSYTSSLVVEIQLQGVDPSLFLSTAEKIQYLRNTQLGGITYQQNIPQFSVSFTLNNSYTPPISEPVVIDDFILIMPNFRKLIINDGGTVVSEQVENDALSKHITVSYAIPVLKAGDHFTVIDSFLKINPSVSI